MPASRAAHATAWPWFPALAATTPAARCSAERVAMRLTAPRIFNAPLRWRFSAFTRTPRAARRDSVSDGKTGVTRAIPAIRARAASMSARLGTVLVDTKDLFHDVAYGVERVELARPHGVQKPVQLRIPGHRRLQVALCPCRGNSEPLAAEVPLPPLGEPAAL